MAQKRYQEAKRVLESDFDLNIDEVYERCGFSSRTSFFRTFREQYQITPAQYRKIARLEAV
ncbi:MAG: AraC family transcriptional regulator [Prevotellaceae bacterium]|nr:AraC family transcriptional regulator [Prevotellaceae bacterium]